ncbi:hypothetical protein G3I34_07250 [Streptomyces sp. SID8014]|uniref:hypothetical protein n=1 Tax=Streptomyces sp. SID8014 TaxID=2706097 RepID=UPI0013BBA3DA|nr:hypothetical protein [Streptomyces sp. SID8014]NEC12089.1 hypothetical protein [Streptomyces sp. SID8014]
MPAPRPAERRIAPAAGDGAAMAAFGLDDPVPVPSTAPFREPAHADGQPWPDHDEDWVDAANQAPQEGPGQCVCATTPCPASPVRQALAGKTQRGVRMGDRPKRPKRDIEALLSYAGC